MYRRDIEEYQLDFLSTPEEPRLVKRRRVETAAAAPRPPQPPQEPTCVRATFSSSVHNGIAYGGSSQACCHQIKLADRLYLALYTRGRAHSGSLSVFFTTSPDDPAGGGRRCTFADWQRSWGPEVTVCEATTVRRDEAPTILDECGLTITLTAHGRAARASLLVLDAPMERSCATCRVISLSSVAAAAQTEEGLIL